VKKTPRSASAGACRPRNGEHCDARGGGSHDQHPAGRPV